jgi:hypothetical protein
MNRQSLIRKAATPADMYRNPVLENVSNAAFQNPADFVARTAFPTIAGPTSGTYYEINTDTIAKNKAAKRAPGTEAAEGTWDISKKTFTCEQLGYREKLPEELVAQGNAAAMADVIAAQSVAEVMLIASEVAWGAAFFATSKWGRDMAGAGSTVADTSYKYWSTSGSTPIADVLAERTRMKKVGKRFPNLLIIGKSVEDYLLTHADILSRVNAGQTPGAGADPTLNDLAKFFKVDRVVVASATYNSALEGATASNDFILDSKSALLMYVAPTPAVMAPTAGYRFADQDVSGNAMGVRNWKYWEQGKRSWYVEGAVDDTYKMVSSNLGTFLSGIVQ